MARLALLLVGAALLGVGLIGFGNPQALMEPLGIALDRPAALGEMRANYGGMHTGMGLFLLTAAFVPTLQRVGLVVVALFVGGLAAGRITSLLVDGWPGAFAAMLCLVEAAGAALALTALVRRQAV